MVALMAVEALRTPPTEAPAPPPEPPAAAPPPDAEDVDVTEPDMELLEEEPPEDAVDWTVPPLELPEEDPPPPEARRPINPPPPPPEKLRLPRNCGPRTVKYFSGPVVPVRRSVDRIFPPMAVAVRTEA